jgi:hypothetical protein
MEAGRKRTNEIKERQKIGSINRPLRPGMVIHISNLSTWETEARGSPIQGQHGQHGKTLLNK